MEPRNHIQLGNDLKLFFFDESSPGSCYFLPYGTVLYNKLVNFIRKEYKKRGYQEVNTPNIFNKKLWETSGHWYKYKKNMFIINRDNSEEADDNIKDSEIFSLKPMNCPSHCIIFKHMNPSYNDLPIRMADFGILHRNELSGALHGLTRVIKFSQDDAHIFCMMNQIETEINSFFDFIDYVYNKFGLEYEVELSTRPPEFIGDIEKWNQAEEILRNCMSRFDKWDIHEGEGAFYGPKIDFTIIDSIGRKQQCGTIQLDFNLPSDNRFNLKYRTDCTECPFEQPVMIHRAIYGSIERFISIMLESNQGNIPFFVSPRQISIISVSVHYLEYAKEIKKKLLEYNDELCVEVDESDNTLQKKIRNSEILHFNYILVVGKKEEQNRTMNIRTNNEKIGEKTIDEFISILFS